MALVTVTGANGTTVVVSFEYPEYATYASDALGGKGDLVKGYTANAAVGVDTPGTTTVTAGTDTYAFGIDSVTGGDATHGIGAVTVIDESTDKGQVFVSGSGTTMDFTSSVNGSGLIIAGSTGNVFNLNAGNWAVLDGDGTAGGSTITTGTGMDTVVMKGADSLTAGSGSDTVYGLATAASITGGTGSLEYIAGQGSSATIDGGSGMITAFANDGASITITGDSSNNIFVAGAGEATMDGSAATGPLTFFNIGGDSSITGGTGNDFFGVQGGSSTLTGGGGTDTFDFFSGGTSGSDVVTDFSSSDYVFLNGNTYTEGADSMGGTLLTLNDGTTIDFKSVSSIDSSHIISGPGPG